MYNRRFSYYTYEVKVSIKHYAIESISKITMRKDKSTLSRNTHNHRAANPIDTSTCTHNHFAHANKSLRNRFVFMCVFFSSSLPTTYTDMPVDLFYFIIHIYQILLSTRIKFITIQSIGSDVLLFVPRQFWHGRLMARCSSIFGLWHMLSSNLINFDTLFFGFLSCLASDYFH